MKKFFVILLATFIFVVAAFTMFVARASASTVQWNGESDKAVAVNIDAVQNNTRKNASGPKITSNAHSADFPDLYFIWDSKQKDNGYLKVKASVFDKYERFTLTTKESNTYWDFIIAPQRGQRMTRDGCYVFYIPKVYNNKNINMVFVSEFVERKREQDKKIEHDKKREHNQKRDPDKKIEDTKKRDNKNGNQDKKGDNDKKIDDLRRKGVKKQ